LFDVGEYGYVACRTCHTARLEPLPDAAQLAGIFGPDYFSGGDDIGGYTDYFADDRVHRANAQARVDHLRRVGVRTGAAVDVGCATGETLTALRDAGWKPVGVEISSTVANVARRRGFEVAATMADLAGELRGRCAVVTFYQSLEHMPDPAAALQAAHDLLGPGGCVVIETWDRGSLVARVMGRHWQQLSPPSVVWVFHRRAGAAMARRAGLSLSSWKTSSKRVGVRWVAAMAAARYPVMQAGMTKLARSRWGNTAVPYRLGDLVTLVLRNDAQVRPA
jgi:SAM-dependent methyltransferase